MALYTCTIGIYGDQVQVDSTAPGQYGDTTQQCWLPADNESSADTRAVTFNADGTDPEPDPAPVPPAGTPAGQAVADYLGEGDDADLVALASRHVSMVTALAKSYTRGNGFDGDFPREDVSAVITMATARMVVNPEAVKREDVGGYSVTPTPFVGWSLVETLTLNRYRKRAS